jgi:hypothetical protein
MTTIKKIFTLSAFILICTLNNVEAQSCTGTNANNVLACSHVSIESCRLATGCTADRKQVLSAQDVVEDTASVCCARTGGKRRACIATAASKLLLASTQAPTKVRTFLRESRRRVLLLRTNGCSTGSLGSL